MIPLSQSRPEKKLQFPENIFKEENFVLERPLSAEEVWAVTCFTGWSGLPINHELRFSKNNLPDLSEEEQRIIDGLKSAFQHSRTSQDMTLYRNVELNLLAESNSLQPRDIKKGCVLKDKGFMEASKFKLEKMYSNDTQLVINVPEGTPAICVAAYTHRDYEMGVLFDEGSVLRIDKITHPRLASWDYRIYCTLLLKENHA